MIWAFPMGAALVSAIFGALTGQQFVSKRKSHQLAWTVAMFMFAVASFSAAMGILGGWTPFWYGIFFWFGAVTNVPVLALGTIYLLGPRKLGHVLAVVVAVASVYAAGAIFPGIRTTELYVVDRIPKAAHVLPNSALLIARYLSFAGFFVVVGGALWSAYKLARERSEYLRNLALANILIAVGTTVVAGASAFLVIDKPLGTQLFSVGLFLGVLLMFLGFLRTRSRAVVPAPPDAAP